MLTDVQSWMTDLVRRLHTAFPDRVLFVGLQGSYRRGEATAESDVDVVAVLDRVDLPDLARYRETVGAMPQGDLACGFLCGRAELLRWPRFDLLQLALDTRPFHGSLDDLLPPFTPADTEEAVRVGASGLYHAAVHGFLYEADRPAALAALSKSVFFLLRLRVFRDTGRYCLTKGELAQCVSPDERPLLSLCPAPERCPDATAEPVYDLLLRWSSALLA